MVFVGFLVTREFGLGSVEGELEVWYGMNPALICAMVVDQVD